MQQQQHMQQFFMRLHYCAFFVRTLVNCLLHRAEVLLQFSFFSLRCVGLTATCHAFVML